MSQRRISIAINENYNHSIHSLIELPPSPIIIPLKWRLYSLTFFMMVGTSISIFLVPLLLTSLLLLFVEIPTTYMYIIFLGGGGSTFFWFGYRLWQDLRQQLTFFSDKITLRSQTSTYEFHWNQIQHIELLPSLMLIQFPKIAALLHLPFQKKQKLLPLLTKHLPQSSQFTLREGTPVNDLRGSRAESPAIIIPYIFAGLGIGASMGAVFGGVFQSGFSLPIFLFFLLGYLVLGKMYLITRNDSGAVLVTNGVIDAYFHKQVFKAPPHSSGPSTPQQPVPWIAWKDVTHFEIYYDSMILQSELGRLEVLGRQEVGSQILALLPFNPTDWTLHKVPAQQIQYPRTFGPRIGPIRRYKLIRYSATFGDKKRAH